MSSTETQAASAPAVADFFAVFELPRKLLLDTKALELAFYRRSREVHPDRFAQASPEKQQWSLEQTSLLNDAYRILKDPITRTEYLLRLEGVTIADGPRNGGQAGEAKANIPPELLSEVFELNMQLEEMRMNAQAGESDPQLRADLEQARDQFTATMAQVDANIHQNCELWDRANETTSDQEQTQAKTNLAALLDKRRYLRNLLRDVGEALSS